MNYTYLISPALLQQYEDVSINIKPERISIFIKKAQELDLKLFLGHALYYDLISCFDEQGLLKESTSQSYQDLLKGCTYTDRFGHTIQFEGLTPTLVYFTFARFIEANAVHYTAAGAVVKNYDNATLLKPSDITKLVQQQRSVANAHVREVEKFLWDNRQDFPLWQYNAQNSTARQAGPRIRGIDKTDFNYPNSTTPTGDYLPLIEFIS